MVSNRKQDTTEKIITAAIDLFSKNGYNGVTTEEIAKEAGFSEKTLFRHFQSKQNLLEQAIDRYHYAEEMRAIFDSKLTWNLKEDLLLISQNYHRIMHRNRKMLRIIMKVGENVPGLHQYSHRHPQALKDFLTNYFAEMKNRKKMVPFDAEQIAITYLYMNFGLAHGRMNEDPAFTDERFAKLIEESVALFTRGLTP
ncbi:TetR/AcrR family transcriptional regulator [Metabacillus sediminilitoris]|uniref:TetR/AcrR family transcriptional regulator n=1 Tax=Metabacillus sediminilitoris TaxID=2567941 RepID=A0A4S4C3M1_9BACI|nr:TetR/AcrR family transcriptional regulator [Metabacillus sediminilitoris]QGQ45360.1 TetR family transcriptional regulator [Metabacillus sediminilitoris]THF82342.1 TetR/AcrR family transcriptional regulator [Metabacillus sediminilitoris]